MNVRAYAKRINLSLAVRGLRPDGYHELETVFQSIALHDTLRFEQSRRRAFSSPVPRPGFRSTSGTSPGKPRESCGARRGAAESRAGACESRNGFRCRGGSAAGAPTARPRWSGGRGYDTPAPRRAPSGLAPGSAPTSVLPLRRDGARTQPGQRHYPMDDPPARWFALVARPSVSRRRRRFDGGTGTGQIRRLTADAVGASHRSASVPLARSCLRRGAIFRPCSRPRGLGGPPAPATAGAPTRAGTRRARGRGDDQQRFHGLRPLRGQADGRAASDRLRAGRLALSRRPDGDRAPGSARLDERRFLGGRRSSGAAHDGPVHLEGPEAPGSDTPSRTEARSRLVWSAALVSTNCFATSSGLPSPSLQERLFSSCVSTAGRSETRPECVAGRDGHGQVVSTGIWIPYSKVRILPPGQLRHENPEEGACGTRWSVMRVGFAGLEVFSGSAHRSWPAESPASRRPLGQLTGPVYRTPRFVSDRREHPRPRHLRRAADVRRRRHLSSC